jgi:alpha-galactosidase
VWVKPLAGGSVAVALFNGSQLPATITTGARTCGLRSAKRYALRNLWSGAQTTTPGTISAQVSAHGAVLLRVSVVTVPRRHHDRH